MTAPFHFKQFSIQQDQCAMKVGTDGVLLGAWAPFQQPKTILDIGTGSGLLALMLQQRFPESNIQAIDIDNLAVTQAKENFSNAKFQPKPSASLSSFQDYIPSTTLDAIICNPPFFKSTTQSNNTARNTARQTQHFSLADFFNWCAKHLSPIGELAIVFPTETEFPLGKWSYQSGLFLKERVDVYALTEDLSPKRTLYLWSKSDHALPLKTSSITIKEKASAQYTEAFQKLTKDFYL